MMPYDVTYDKTFLAPSISLEEVLITSVNLFVLKSETQVLLYSIYTRFTSNCSTARPSPIEGYPDPN